MEIFNIVMKNLCIAIVLVMTFCLNAEPSKESILNFDFKQDQWDKDNWINLKCPRWDQNVGSWLQARDHIYNQVPLDITTQEMIGKRASETFVSMIRKEKFNGNVEISSQLSFDDRMAPLILITPEYVPDAKGRLEYRRQWEFVLYDEGLVVWQHFYNMGKCTWQKTAYLKAKFEPKTKYELHLKVVRTANGQEITFKCNNHEMIFWAQNFPEEYYAGITADEGINRFYDFKVKGNLAK